MPGCVLRRRFTHSQASIDSQPRLLTAQMAMMFRRANSKDLMTSPLPAITIGIVAFNEEESIPKTIRSLRAASRNLCGSVEFIVLASGCTDRTAEVAIDAFYGDHRARVIQEQSRLSKCAALNRLADSAHGGILLFIDADVEVDPTALHLLFSALCDEPGLAIAFGRMIPRAGPNRFWTGIGVMTSEALHSVRALSDGSGLWLVCGPLYAIRATAWPGLPEGLIADDVYLGILCRTKGLPVRYLPDAIAFGMYPQNLRDLLSQKLRNRLARLQLRTFEGDSFRSAPLWMAPFAIPRLGWTSIRHLPILLIDTVLCFVALLLWASGHTPSPLWRQVSSTKLR